MASLLEQYNTGFTDGSFRNRVNMALLSVAWDNLSDADPERAAFAKAVAGGSKKISSLIQALMASQDIDDTATDAVIRGAISTEWSNLAKAFGT
jgi:6,7-dimethyl-8-ribityllumazine synthase